MIEYVDHYHIVLRENASGKIADYIPERYTQDAAKLLCDMMQDDTPSGYTTAAAPCMSAQCDNYPKYSVPGEV